MVDDAPTDTSHCERGSSRRRCSRTKWPFFLWAETWGDPKGLDPEDGRRL